MKQGMAYCKDKIAELAKVKTLVGKELEKLKPKCEIPRADGALYYFIKVNTTLSSMALAERLVREYKVAVIPGSAFGVEEVCTLRVSYGALDKETVVGGVGRLVRGLNEILDIGYS